MFFTIISKKFIKTRLGVFSSSLYIIFFTSSLYTMEKYNIKEKFKKSLKILQQHLFSFQNQTKVQLW
jgi:hypothetical protein